VTDELFEEGGVVAIPEREVERVRAELQPVLAAASQMVVKDESSYLAAVSLGKECTRRAKLVEDTWKEPREKAHAAWKAITEKIASFVNPLKEAAKIVDGKAYQWKRAEDEKARAEAERKRQEERKRIEEERLRQAEELEKAGAHTIADAVMAAPIEVEHIEAATVAPVAGVSYRENWQFEISDASAIPRDYLTPDVQKIGKMVKALKGTTNIPGVRVFDAGTVVHR